MTLTHAELSSTSFRLDPALRSQLPAGVLARPLDDAVPLHVWVLVAETLEASAHALSCVGDGTSGAVVEVLVGFAEGTAGRAEAELLVHVLAPAAAREQAGSALQVAERTWLRLAAVLLSAPPTDPSLLLTCIRDHRRALAAWRAGF